MPLRYETVVTTSISKQISESIREAIVDGRIRFGERLPTEEELAERYGVSRPTVREALKRLAAQNLVRSRRGPLGGNFVITPDPDESAQMLIGSMTLLVSVGAFDFEAILTARLELETVCCRMAAANRSEEDLVALRTALAGLSDPKINDEEFCAADVRFHRALVDATGNGPLRFIMHAVVEAMLPIMNMVVFRVRERRSIVAFHSQMLDAIEARSAKQATQHLRELLTYLSGRYAAALRARAATRPAT